MSKKKPNISVLNSIARRANYFATQMIHIANQRTDKAKGDPKVGGHPAASASALHILGALHLYVKSGFDHIAVKPHASPADHSLNYLLDLLLEKDLSRMDLQTQKVAMTGLRKFSQNGEPVFQSYHSKHDPDCHNFFPSGTVGIPPVNAGYLALAYRYAEDHGYNVPENAHFWAVIGDSEFREGSLYEAMPDFAERQLGNLTWIIDYNRQSLDGHRITNKKIMQGTDDLRIERTAKANGWDVIQVRHGGLRKNLFKKIDGQRFKKFLEDKLEDYELQSLLLVPQKEIKQACLKHDSSLKAFLKDVTDSELYSALRDFGGHDFEELISALEASKKDPDKPTIVVAHTIKGWGLLNAAAPGNHSSLPAAEEVDELRQAQEIPEDDLFQKFAEDSVEAKYLKARGDQLYAEILVQNELRAENKALFQEIFKEFGDFPQTLGINLKMVNYPHTQWMLGQLTAKLTRIANTPLDESQLAEKQKPLADIEKPMKFPAELLLSMAPDVGTSTNLNPAMDGKVFGAEYSEDFASELHVKDTKVPDLVPGDDKSDRFLRFEIAEGNVMSCLGSFGQMRNILGIPLLPLMTVYDFFVKRALDQYFYDLYWESSFILGGTPSGVTLSPEGAQHGWKSDIEIPNQVTWEPFFCQELDWIFCDAIRRHMSFDNKGRSGVFVRGSTRGADQKEFLKRLKRQQRFKTDQNQTLLAKGLEASGGVDESTVAALDEETIFSQIREDVLSGGYYLVDYRGYAGYEPGDNVVHIFAMGALGKEALEASDKLLEKGIYANVIMVTSPDLLLSNSAYQNNYQHLKQNLGIDAKLYLVPHNGAGVLPADLMTLSGRRIPIVSVHDGEPGLLDNIGSIVGVRHEALAVRQHSKCGRPQDVYRFHGIDTDSIVLACGKVLSQTALEEISVSKATLQNVHEQKPKVKDWRELWPEILK